jgi:SAM-dependent methyltransferase
MSAATTTSSFPNGFFDELAAAEDHHFWFRARNRLIGRVLTQIAATLPPDFLALEIGTGTGNVLRIFEDTCRCGRVVGMDYFDEGLRHAQQRTSSPLVRGDVFRLPFRGPVHLVGMFDVLEHLSDDREALRQIHKLLASDGLLLLTVPAYMALWSEIDEFAGHFRRYSPETLRTALNEAGFQVDYLSPFMLTLAPLMWATRRRSRVEPDVSQLHERVSKQFRIVPVVNDVMLALLTCEVPFLARRTRLPFGSSILAIGRKRVSQAVHRPACNPRRQTI